MKVSLSDRSLAEWSVDHTERRVLLIPKENGRFKVTVEDPGLYGSEPVHSEILVSDISKVKLDVPQQLSLSSTVKAKLRVYASDGTEFPTTQLKHMSFENPKAPIEGEALQKKKKEFLLQNKNSD